MNSVAAPRAIARDTEVMLFDQPRELPSATVRRARDAQVGLVIGALQRWLSQRWRWLKPRAVPVLAALLGMVAVLQAVSYLSHPPPAAAARSAAAPTGILVIATEAARSP